MSRTATIVLLLAQPADCGQWIVLFAFHGAYLRIDATTGRAERVALPESVLRRYLGGSGLGARLLLDEGGATAEPFSRDAPLSGRQNCLFR